MQNRIGYTGSMYINPPQVPTGIPQAREHTSAAIAALVLALNDPRRAVEAAKALLAFGWGRPGAPTPNGGNQLADWTDAEIRKGVEFVREQIRKTEAEAAAGQPQTPPAPAAEAANRSNRAATSCPVRHDSPAAPAERSATGAGRVAIRAPTSCQAGIGPPPAILRVVPRPSRAPPAVSPLAWSTPALRRAA